MSSTTKQNYFYLLFSLLFFSTNEPLVYASVGIDPSWTESLVMAINQNFIFGKDFIFNYGPLGYLNTALLPSGSSPFVLFIFHLFLLANLLFIIKLAFDKLKENWWKAAIAAVVILLPWGFFADVTFTLFYFLVFWLLYVHQTKKALGLLIALVLAVLIFYIKVNLSLIAYGLVLLSLVYFTVAKTISWKTGLIVVGILGLATFSFSLLLNVSIPDYLAASLKIIDAYQDGQAVNILRFREVATLLLLEFIILGVVLFYLLRNLVSFKQNFYLYLLCALAWFLCFKQAHTATGHYNVFGFFLFLPVLAVLIFLFSKQLKNGARMVFWVLILQIVSTQYIRLSMANYSPKHYVLGYFPNAIIAETQDSKSSIILLKTFLHKNPVHYFRKLLTYDYQNNFKNSEINKRRMLPKAIRESIGDKSVDIMPWEISYVFFNKLNYNPRPIIQTYQANSDWLACKNEEKYTSNSSPDVVLANIHGYREQNPFWMDKGAYLSLVKNYTLKDTVVMPEEKFYLFEKNVNIRPIGYSVLRTKKTHLGNSISIPSNDLLYLHADIHYNFFGKIARLFFQPPYLRCTAIYEDGSQKQFRIPPPILKGGILASQSVVSNQEFAHFAQGHKTKKIVSLTFWSTFKWGFKSNFDYHFEKIIQ
jgi:hypothetical protein